MGIGAKETGAILCKVLGYSMKTSIKFMRNYPILSGVSMFLLLLYIFLPSLLFFLIYSSPVLACALVYSREKLGLRFSSSHRSVSSLGPTSRGGENGGGRCQLRQQRSVRRNARMKVEEWDSQTSEEEKDKVILTSLYNDLLGRTPHFEESPKAVEDNHNVMDVAEEHSPMSSQDFEINEEKCGRVDDKEETKEEISNGNEHALAEIEKNKRLESLIARRKARRLFKLALHQRNKLQAEEATSLTQKNNLQVTVRKNNSNSPFEKRRNGLQVPGSAPSVILQGRNPFDIPYDPQEERPNLTGDSFDEEFSFFNHKDMFLSRHESFCRSSLFFPEHAQCMNSSVPASDPSAVKKHLGLDKEYMDHTEQNLPCNDKEASIEDGHKSVEIEKSGEREVEIDDETDSDKEGDDSSSAEESESELCRLNKAELREAICHSMDNHPGFQTRNNIPSTLPRGLVATRLDDNNIFYSRRCANPHTRTFSVASDMQVEVSEIGSPPTTVDWLEDWSNAGESYMYDTDLEREVACSEASCKKVNDQYESRSVTGSKEESDGPDTKLVGKPDQIWLDEQLRMVDDTSMIDTRSQTEVTFEQKPSNFSGVFKPTSSVKFEGLLLRPSVSLSSITEEPETIFDSMGNSENTNCLTGELTDHRSPTSLDSSMKKLIDEEAIDVQELENDDLCGYSKNTDSSIFDDQQKDPELNNIQGEYGTEINMTKHPNTDLRENEATLSLLDASLDIPYVKSFGREMEEEPSLDILTEDITKQSENEALQSDLKSSPDSVLTELLQNEVMEKNSRQSVKDTDEETNPVEQEKIHNFLNASSNQPCTQIGEDYGNAENASDVILLQVQDDNSTLNNSTDKEISNEGENTGLLNDFHAESTQEYNDRTSVQEESILSTDSPNSQSSQPLTEQGINSMEEISPRALEITQQQEHEDVIAINNVSQDILKDEFSVEVARESAANENNDEGNLKPDEEVGEANKEKELERNLGSMHHKVGTLAKEDVEESKKESGALHNAETETTKEENRVLED